MLDVGKATLWNRHSEHRREPRMLVNSDYLVGQLLFNNPNSLLL